MTLAQAKRQWKRDPIFRDPLFARAEMDDPIGGRPFVQHGQLPAIERNWHFKKNAVPSWIRLYLGRAARRRTLWAIDQEYALPPAERFLLIEESLQCAAYSTLDPQSWNIPFLCAVKIPTPEPSAIWWWGGRDAALSNPVVRGWYYNEQAQVFHGAAAFEVARREWNKGAIK